jgi:hypothetical protein
MENNLAIKLLNTNGKIVTVTFTKKDGSIRIMNCRLGVTKHLKGGSSIDLKWIEPDKKYIGFGSIGSIEGDDIAKELNNIYNGIKQSRQFIVDHFQYIKIG